MNRRKNMKRNECIVCNDRTTIRDGTSHQLGECHHHDSPALPTTQHLPTYCINTLCGCVCFHLIISYNKNNKLQDIVFLCILWFQCPSFFQHHVYFHTYNQVFHHSSSHNPNLSSNRDTKSCPLLRSCTPPHDELCSGNVSLSVIKHIFTLNKPRYLFIRCTH